MKDIPDCLNLSEGEPMTKGFCCTDNPSMTRNCVNRGTRNLNEELEGHSIMMLPSKELRESCRQMKRGDERFCPSAT